MNIIVGELLKVKELLKTKGDILSGTLYQSLNDVILDVDNCIFELNWDESNALNIIANLLSFQSDIYKIALNNGWGEQLVEIDKKVSNEICKIRVREKNEVSNFHGIKEGVYTDASTFAGDPGNLTISKKKWKDISKFFKLNLFQRIELHGRKKIVRERICYGDSQPAMVMRTDPLLIAAYADEMDAVVILKFPTEYALKYNLKQYDRIIAVNTYAPRTYVIPHDIYVGKHYLHRWSNFESSIAEFLSDDIDIINRHKATMPESLWLYVKSLGEDYLLKHPNKTRKGFWFLKYII